MATKTWWRGLRNITMGKRSNFKKIEKDFYPSIDPRIGEALAPYVRGCRYAEPCYGSGDLESQLMDAAMCFWRSDIRENSGERMDALKLSEEHVTYCDYIITNPPFSRGVLLPMIRHFTSLRPTWLLLPGDMIYNKYMREFTLELQMVVPVGRLYWFMENGKYTRGTDNYAWFLFDNRNNNDTSVRFMF